MHIQVVVLDGVFDTGLTTVLDVFATANDLAVMQALSLPRIEVTVTGVHPEVGSAQGLRVPVSPLAQPSPDWVVVPALGCKMPDALCQALERDDVSQVVAALRRWAGEGVGLAAACIGTFLLGESGVLDDRPATTTWWLTPLFRQRYPRVRLDTSRMVVADDRLITAGAALSHVDMALTLVGQLSPALANLTARYLIADARESQSAYAISSHLVPLDPLTERFDHWVRGRLHRRFSLDEAASALATSKRTLSRRLNTVLGTTPVAYVQALRIERAVELLKTSDQSIERIAEQVGYADGVTLRTLLRQRLGKGVRELRRA